MQKTQVLGLMLKLPRSPRAQECEKQASEGEEVGDPYPPHRGGRQLVAQMLGLSEEHWSSSWKTEVWRRDPDFENGTGSLLQRA